MRASKRGRVREKNIYVSVPSMDFFALPDDSHRGEVGFGDLKTA